MTETVGAILAAILAAYALTGVASHIAAWRTRKRDHRQQTTNTAAWQAKAARLIREDRTR